MHPGRKQNGIKVIDVIFEIFTAVTMKNAFLCDVAPCRYCANRRFGRTDRLQTATTCSRWFLALGFLYPEDEGDMFLETPI
jgi:hypothetical protein